MLSSTSSSSSHAGQEVSFGFEAVFGAFSFSFTFGLGLLFIASLQRTKKIRAQLMTSDVQLPVVPGYIAFEDLSLTVEFDGFDVAQLADQKTSDAKEVSSMQTTIHTLNLQLIHPTLEKRDVTVLLQRLPSGQYAGVNAQD